MTLTMSARKVLGALVDAWRYHFFRTGYAPLNSILPIVGSRHFPISSTNFSVHYLYSTRRYLQTDFVSLHSMFLLCHGLRRREARSSIIRVDGSEIHWGSGGRVGGGGVSSSVFHSYCFLSAGLKSSGAGRDRGKARLPRR